MKVVMLTPADCAAHAAAHDAIVASIATNTTSKVYKALRAQHTAMAAYWRATAGRAEAMVTDAELKEALAELPGGGLAIPKVVE